MRHQIPRSRLRRGNLVKQTAGDDLRLNFGGPLKDVQDARVTQDAADLVFHGKAVAAVDLQRVIGAGPCDAGAELAFSAPYPRAW